MEMVGVAGNVVVVIRNSTANWKTVLTSTGGNNVEVNIYRRISEMDCIGVPFWRLWRGTYERGRGCGV